MQPIIYENFARVIKTNGNLNCLAKIVAIVANGEQFIFLSFVEKTGFKFKPEILRAAFRLGTNLSCVLCYW